MVGLVDLGDYQAIGLVGLVDREGLDIQSVSTGNTSTITTLGSNGGVALEGF